MSGDTRPLPVGWTTANVDEIATTATGGTPSRQVDAYFGGTIPWVKSGNLNDGIVTEIDESITDAGLQNSNAKLFPKGTVCIALYGATVGRLGVLAKDAATNQAVCGVFPHEGIESKYVFHALRHERERLIAQAKGGAQPNISNGIIRSTEIPLPPQAEQRRMVVKIEALQEQTSKAKQALADVRPLLEQFRQRMLFAAFSGRLTAKWRLANKQIKPVRAMLDHLPEPPKPPRASKASIAKIKGDCGLSVGLTDMPIPTTWSWTRLTRLGQLVTGHTPSREHPEYWNGEIAWIGIKDARNNNGRVIENTLQHVTELGIENSASRVLPKGTVLMTRTANSIGYSVVLGRDMATSQDLVGWILPEEVNPKFLMYLLLAENDALYRFAKGSAHPTVYFPEILSFHIALPPTEEQNEIVRRVEVALEVIKRQAASLSDAETDLRAFDESVLVKAFRGELVAQDPRDEPAAELLARIRNAKGNSERTGRGKSGSRNPTTSDQEREPLEPDSELTLGHLLQQTGGRMTIDDAQRISGLSHADFFATLKEEIQAGTIKEINGPENNRYLVLVK